MKMLCLQRSLDASGILLGYESREAICVGRHMGVRDHTVGGLLVWTVAD